MVKEISKAGLLLSVLLGSSVFAESGTDKAVTESTAASKSVEVGILGVGLIEGNDDPLQSTFPGVGVRLGYYLSPSWELVAEGLATFDAEYDVPGQSNVNVVDYMAGLNYDLLFGTQTVKPFVSLEVGYRTISSISGRDQWQAYPGLGIKFLLSDSWQILAEAKARFNLEENEKGALGTIGFSYLFGGDEPAAAPVQPEPAPAAVEPEPAPTPAPVVETPPAPVDSDNDGVFDPDDMCPDTKSGLKVDDRGCPVTMNFVLRFGFDSAVVEDSAGVESFASFLKENMPYKVTLKGYADDTGPAAYNQKLSEKRANAVKAALEKDGIDGERIATEGKGESDPVAVNTTKEGRALNRRVEAELSAE